ncbi:hypothetical protein HO173_010004 [Letharia columbiana]|uniref:Uncharacterized protein n=1 Tax=Letharia columbiana TaxID=112416 RepID=A0A8H6FNB9_9LECA|nr:uncharacterized protein HO173_010004 [Letharia columbiana]KAF6231702.1 hypothetical protein HO173_010004 [Letharia columbiana]
MAPSHEESRLATGVMTYMGQISEQTSSRYDKKIARSSELENFIWYLSERAPSSMNGLLKSASRKCEEALRAEKEARIARKRPVPPNGNDQNAKRLHITHSTEKETVPSQRAAEIDSMAQGHADALQRSGNTIPACDNGIAIKLESEQEPFDWTNMMDETLVVYDSDEHDDTSRQLVPESTYEVPNSLTGPVNSGLSIRKISIGKRITLQTAQLDVRDDMAEQMRSANSNGDETTTPRSKSYCSDMTPLHTSASKKVGESRVEDSDEDTNPKPTENKPSNVAATSVHELQVGEIVPLPTQYQVEVGLFMKTPAIEACVKAHCLKLKPFATRPHFDVHDEMAKILDKSRLLEFYKVRRELYQYLEDRVKMPGKKLQARTIWNMSDPGEILDALQTVKTNTADTKIHRAYGQTMLFSSVNTQVARGYKSTVSGHRLNHRAILEELALKKAGSVSKAETNYMISGYLHEYYAGQKWSAVIDWFRGSGIVLVFVTAGIGNHYVETKWTEFQRDCLQYIAGLLHSIRGLVETLGSDALELYCRHGCLDNQCIERVKLAKFTQPDADEEPEDELGDEEPEDEEPEDESD